MRAVSRDLKVSIGQCSEQGRKPSNQDFYGALVPEHPLLGAKGIAVVLADGISSSDVGRTASETAVKSFLTDYYCTAESWSVKTSAQRVIAAINSWLYAQTRRSAYAYDKDKGYVCTFSAIVFRSTTAHIFHLGDARIYRLANGTFEQLTNDHRVVISTHESYLGRALGVNPQVEIDYLPVTLSAGDVFLLATDGVHEYVDRPAMLRAIEDNAGSPDAAAAATVADALRQGSPDNLTVQIVRIDDVPHGEAHEAFGSGAELPVPPLPEPGAAFDGFRIVRELHASHRSHLYLAHDDDALVVLKLPSIEMRDDELYLKRLMMEEWIARRVHSPHLVKAAATARPRSYQYAAFDYVEGQSLAQWMIDHPSPNLETVRGIVEQIARGLHALHRMEMLHQDLRPENVIIDRTGTAKIVDLGSVFIAGIAESSDRPILGTLQYTAPEYFVGDGGSTRSDLFSLGVLAYQMLTGRLPYGADAAKVRTRAQQHRLRYRTALQENRAVPAWIDLTLQRAVHPDPAKRYQELSEFLFDLRQPNAAYLQSRRPPLIERHPLLFWQCACALLALLSVGLFLTLMRS